MRVRKSIVNVPNDFIATVNEMTRASATVGELLAGKDIDYPPSSHKQDVTFKQAPKVKERKGADLQVAPW